MMIKKIDLLLKFSLIAKLSDKLFILSAMPSVQEHYSKTYQQIT